MRFVSWNIVALATTLLFLCFAGVGCGSDSSAPETPQSGGTSSLPGQVSGATDSGDGPSTADVSPGPGTSVTPSTPGGSSPTSGEPTGTSTSGRSSTGSDTSRNACGGVTVLELDGAPAEPDDACGPCEDGLVVCEDDETLACVDASTPNACGACEEAPGELGDACDECAAWACEAGAFACVPALIDPSCEVVLDTCDDLACEEQGRACEEGDGVVGARCAGCLEGFDSVEGTCLAALAAPELVEASDDVPDWVEVSWSEVDEAEAWAIYRDGERIAELDPPEERTWQDLDIAPGTVGSVVLADVEETPTEAALVLTPPDAFPGPVAAYAVRALAEGRSALRSEEAEGRRAAPVFQGFEAQDAGDWVPVPARWVLPAAPPEISVGSATASQDVAEGVRLEATGFEAVDGPLFEASVRARFSAGEGIVVRSGASDFGARRIAGPLELQWERSESVEGPFVDTGLRGTSVLDEDAPADASPRWYRVCGVSEGAESRCATPVEGSVLPVPPVVGFEGDAAVEAERIQAIVTIVEAGSSDPDELGFCARELDASGQPTGSPRCVSAAWSAASVPLEIAALRPGARYRITPRALWRGVTVEGEEQTLRLLPGALSSLSVTQVGPVVRLDWPEAQGATSYRILRDGEAVGTVDAPGLSWTDVDVVAGSWDAAGIALEATTDRVDGTVALSWNEPDASAGGTYVWRVEPRNADDAAGERSPEEGLTLTPAAINAWEVQVGEGDWQSLPGEELAFVDPSPPGPTVTAGALERIEPERTDAVVLRVTGAGAQDGALRVYRVRAIPAYGDVVTSAPASGRAAAGALRYRWQRSSGPVLPVSEAEWNDIAGDEAELADSDAPESRELRWWRALVDVEAAEARAIAPISAFRAPVLPVASLVSVSSDAPRTFELLVDGAVSGSPPVLARVCAQRVSDGASASCGGYFGLVEGAQTVPFVGGALAGELLRFRLEYLDLEEQDVVLDEGLEGRSVPAAVSAFSQNESFRSATSIRLSWTGVANATGYVLLREGEEIATLDAGTLLFTDGDGPRGQVRYDAVAVGADEDNQNGVAVSWSGFVAEEGPETQWSVAARNEAGRGPAVSLTSRLRAPVVDRALVEYGEGLAQEREVEEPAGIPSGVFLPDVPLGPVNFDGVIVSDDRTDGVQLDASGVGLLPGPDVPVRVTFFDSVGGGSEAFLTSGRAAPMTINSLSWERAEDAEGAGAQTISIQAQHLDTPPFLQPTWYRLNLRSPGGARTPSSPWIQGRRVTASPAIVSAEPFNVEREGVSPSFRASFRVDVTQASTPSTIFLGYCVSSTGAPDLEWEGADCDEEREFLEVTSNLPSRTLQVTGIEPGQRLWYRSRARVRLADNSPGGPWVDGGVVVLDAPVLPVDDLAASEGTSDAHVALSWTLPQGAVAVDVYRDGQRIAQAVEGESFLDTGAPEGGVAPEMLPTVTRYLSSDASPDHVVVTFAPVTGSAGAPATYEVVALGAAGFEAEPSNQATGFRAGFPITGYEFSRTESSSDAPVWEPIPAAQLEALGDGDTVTQWRWLDTDAPRHDLALSVSATSLIEGVRANWSATIGAAQRREAFYRVRGVNAAGPGANFSGRVGSRATSGEATVRVFRTTDGQETLLQEVVGAGPSGGGFVDTLANIDNAPESYRVEWSAAFAEPQTGTASGARLEHAPSLSLGEAVSVSEGWAVPLTINAPGNPAQDLVIVCQIEDGTGFPAPTNPSAICATQLRPWGPGDTEVLLAGDASFGTGDEVAFSVWRDASFPGPQVIRVVTVP